MIAPDFALRHCIDWNSVELNRAERDAANANVIVPRYMVKREGGKLVPLTIKEYRDVRHADADRHERNIIALLAQLA